MIEVRGLNIRLGEFRLVDVNLRVEEGEYFVLLGPTGAGKTVLVECIAGLHVPDSGRILIDGRDVTEAPPEERGVGYVPQDYALFPHLTVYENMAFGLKLRKVPKKEEERAISEWVEKLRIGHLLGRHPLTLSGGEKQRVALARALVLRPKVLLLDEPLSALDERSRERLIGELKAIHKETGATTIHVCHNFEEALALADKIGVINEGRIVQVGSPEEIFYRPRSEFVALFTRAENVFRGRSEPIGDGLVRFVTEGGVDFVVRGEKRGEGLLVVRPEELRVSLGKPADSPNVLRGGVRRVVDRGAMVRVEVASEPPVVALVPKGEAQREGIEEGKKVFVSFPPEKGWVI